MPDSIINILRDDNLGDEESEPIFSEKDIDHIWRVSIMIQLTPGEDLEEINTVLEEVDILSNFDGQRAINSVLTHYKNNKTLKIKTITVHGLKLVSVISHICRNE